MKRMTRRTWLRGCGGAMVGLLGAACQTPAPLPAADTAAHQHSAAAPPAAEPAPAAPAPTVTAVSPASAAPVLIQTGGLQTAQLQVGDAAPADPNALRIPPLLSPPAQDGVRTFDLTLQRGQMAFEPGFPVATLGINGPYLGPTLRAAQGDTLAFAVLNQIGEPTTLHWHGMHVPAAMDGGPHQEVAPGATWQPEFTIRQQAATLWFHSHLIGRSRDQVTRGLAAMFILDDDNPAQAMLPHAYGVDDIPLILQDYGAVARVGGAGQGGRTLMNGSLGPVLATAQPRLRLRLLNGSDQRIYSLGFAGDLPFHEVASDGGLLEAPVRLTRLQLAPAERAEIVLDLADAPGDAPLLLQQFGGFGRGGGLGSNGGQGATLLTIRGPGERAARAAGLPPLPDRLNTYQRLDPATAAVTRPMVLGGGRGGRTINGQAMAGPAAMHDMTNALRVRQGDVERWDVVNQSRDTHVFHVHDVQFQILGRNGAAPAPAEQGRKDTVVVRPGETAPLLMRFEEYADPDNPYMFHCHILQHEDQGMMGQFVVVSA